MGLMKGSDHAQSELVYGNLSLDEWSDNGGFFKVSPSSILAM